MLIENKLHDSMTILLVLNVTIKQKYESWLYYENNLIDDSEPFKRINLTSKKEIDTTIIDSIKFQLLLDICSFLDEWDNFMGVKFPEPLQSKIIVIKKVVKSARQAINKFNDLKKFRNQIIAHNLRDKGKNFVFHKIAEFNVPNSLGENYIVVYAISRMFEVLTRNLEDDFVLVHKRLNEQLKENFNSGKEPLSDNEIEKIIIEIESGIDERIWDIPRYEIINSLINRNI